MTSFLLSIPRCCCSIFSPLSLCALVALSFSHTFTPFDCCPSLLILSFFSSLPLFLSFFNLPFLASFFFFTLLSLLLLLSCCICPLFFALRLFYLLFFFPSLLSVLPFPSLLFDLVLHPLSFSFPFLFVLAFLFFVPRIF